MATSMRKLASGAYRLAEVRTPSWLDPNPEFDYPEVDETIIGSSSDAFLSPEDIKAEERRIAARRRCGFNA